ncbi:MAG: glycine cleavage system protein R [Actinomycetota bacterium]
MAHALIAVTVIGPDRPGIVAAVTRVLYERGCNLEDASSTILRGHFSMVLIVRIAESAEVEGVRSALRESADDLGLVVTARPVAETEARVPSPTHTVSVYGADRPGIVFRVARALADASVNITDLTSRIIGPAEHPVYALIMEVVAPGGRDPAGPLAGVAEELGVDVTVRETQADVL